MRILLIEDDRALCTALLPALQAAGYTVDTCHDGADGKTLLCGGAYDVCVLDRMLPGLDGLSLLRAARATGSTTPVLMPTAPSGINDQVDGLDARSDAYLGKPFSTNLLMAQISNLISNRENRRKFYFNSPIANMKAMAYTKADESFLEKLNEIINEHIGNPALDVNMIADLMHLSRPTLYRKIRAISDLTPNELLTLSRLKKAAALLIQGNMNIY